jgi:2-haloacid dehalogenase
MHTELYLTVNSAAEKCKDKIGDKWEGFANYWRTTQLEYTLA